MHTIIVIKYIGPATFDWREFLGTFGNKLKGTNEEKDRNGGPCLFDEAFKRMAVDLSYAKGSMHEASRELGIDSIAAANRSHYQMATVGRCRRFIEILLRLPLFSVG